MKKQMQKGFTLIELLIVVAIIGILAAIAIPNMLTALQKSRQKRTMADMRSIATAWEARATDANSYVAAGGVSIPTSAMDSGTLSGLLTPTYIKSLPKKDGWGRGYVFAADSNAYAIKSGGRPTGTETVDTAVAAIGTADAANPGATTSFDADILFSNGAFVVYPEGTQKN